jgi:hypothetical protein
MVPTVLVAENSEVLPGLRGSPARMVAVAVTSSPVFTAVLKPKVTLPSLLVCTVLWPTKVVPSLTSSGEIGGGLE